MSLEYVFKAGDTAKYESEHHDGTLVVEILEVIKYNDLKSKVISIQGTGAWTDLYKVDKIVMVHTNYMVPCDDPRIDPVERLHESLNKLEEILKQ